MDGWIGLGIAALAVVLGYVANRLGIIDLSNKNRSSGNVGGALGSLDEVFHPTRHEAQVELDRQTMLPAPAPVPGDRAGRSIFEGKVTIDLSDVRR
jgi:hypothetical protein